jgi:threonine/homoserine/homoserine lactone efflux protein
VLETSWRILLFGLVAGLSPIAIVSTLAVLTSRRGRANGLAFAGGFMVGQAAAFSAAYLVGSAATTDTEGNVHVAAGLELAFGIFLLAIAWPQRRRPETAAVVGHSRTKKLLERLRGLRPWTAFSAGTLLGVGGVKRLSITIVAGASVGIANLSPAEDLAVAILYVAVGGLLVWLPVSIYVVAGARAEEWIAAAEDWLTANERRLMFFSTVLFGLLLTSDALVRLS